MRNPIALSLVLMLGPQAALAAPDTQTVRKAPQGQQPEPLPLELRRLLVEGKHDTLAKMLEAKQKAFETSVTNEDALWQAFLSFNVADTTLAEPMDRWVERSNGSWSARLARGFYLERRAATERGGNWISETSREQITSMMHFLALAEAEFRAALEKNPKAVMGHDGLMALGQYRGDARSIAEAYDRAVALAPASLEIRLARMCSLTPEWGGSYEEMMAVARDAQRHIAANPRLVSLPGYVALAQATTADRSSDPAAALRFLSQALGTGEEAAFLSTRCRVRCRQKQYAEALVDCERALALRPQGWWYMGVRLPDTMYFRAMSLEGLGKLQEALATLEEAARIDPSIRERYSPAFMFLRYKLFGEKPQPSE